MNLKHIPLEKLEELPPHLSIKWEMIGLKTHRTYIYSNRYDSEEYRIANCILNGSKGRKAEDVFNKARKLLNAVNISSKDTFENYIPIYYEDGKPYKRWRGREYAITGAYVNEQGLFDINPRKKLRHPRNFLKKVNPRTEKKNRKAYEYYKSCILLKFINDPQLYKFYLKIRGSYEYAVRKIKEVPPPKPDKFVHTYKGTIFYTKTEILKAESHWKWQLRRLEKEKEKARQDLLRLEPQIEALESGNLDIWYHSNEYISGLQKECHHFEQP